MLKTYLKAALRSLVRRRDTTTINLFGLALACGVALLFGLLAHNLSRYDASFSGADDVYLVWHDVVSSESSRRTTSSWTPLLPALEAEVPAIAAGTRFGWGEFEIEQGGRRWLDRVHFADAAFFEVFPFPFVEGEPATAHGGPRQAVVAADALERLFGETDPREVVGRTLWLDGESEVVVTGVVDVPRNVTMQFDVLASWAFAEQHLAVVRDWGDSWTSSTFPTYVRLRPDADVGAVEAGFDAVVARNHDGEDRIGVVPTREWMAAQNDFPLYARIFSLIALGVLGIAAVNFANLATARSLARAREVGVRKTLGASRAEIAAGYLAEAALMAVPAVLGGLALASAALPWFNGLTEGLLTLAFDLGDVRLWGALAGLAAFMTVVAGGYPALVLARFRPVDAFGGRLAARPSARRLRSGLVVLQFTLTAFLLASAVTVHQQVRYLHEIGFQFGETPVAVASIPAAAFDDPDAGAQAARAFRDRLRRDPAVAQAALSQTVPGDCCSNTTLRLGGSERALDVRINYVDPQYFDLYEMDVSPALDPARTLPETGRAVVINDAMAEAAGWTAPVGQTLHPDPETTWTVVGTTKDYAYMPPRYEATSFVHVLSGSLRFGRLSVRSATADAGPLTALLAREWGGTGARRALDVEFADEIYAAEYVPEEAMRGLVGYAAGFATLISMVGLLGLATLLAEQRTKEIGVRKILGATVAQIVSLLTRGPAALVVLAVVLAAPLVVVAMRAWLSMFPSRISLSPLVLLAVGALVLGATVVVVGVQALRAATADPVRALRSE